MIAEASLSLAFALVISPHTARRASKACSGPTAREPFARALLGGLLDALQMHVDTYLDAVRV
ncbi:hypothetical protein [Paraburkholderia youngii]